MVPPSDLLRPSLEETLIARLSHDLFNPLGAIANGIELLSLTEASAEMQLVQDSVTLATSKLKLFRGAFGPASRAEGYSTLEVRALLRELGTLSRYRYAFDAPTSLSAQEFRLLCLVLLFAESALPVGGKIEFRRTGEQWQMDAEGPKIRYEPADLELSEAREPARVHLVLLARALNTRPWRVDPSPTRLSLFY